MVDSGAGVWLVQVPLFLIRAFLPHVPKVIQIRCRGAPLLSYQVLARKWRPASFDEIVGQEHVLRAMINALDNQRLHHAYLFTGTRGVGKTTLARILAKCFNCEAGISSKPCGQCQACTEIAEGRFVDLIEVDAASRTKVDDTRELLDNVQYAPASGRFKVYLIDEVHMLSTHSFNALLKTLEEPPPHVKFLLATTDPQKLPVTVLSRCLQFNLKRVPEDLIAGHLQKILEAESVAYEQPALRHLAHAAEGSLRDALSLLDQGIAFGDGKVTEADIGQMLGSISRTHLNRIVLAVAEGDAEAVMACVDELAALSPDYDAVLASMITLLHDLALAQHIPGSLEMHGLDVHELSEIAAKMLPEDIQLYYEIAVRARRDLSLIPDPRHALEMALLRMLAFRPAAGGEGGAPRPQPSSSPSSSRSSPQGRQPSPAPAGNASSAPSGETAPPPAASDDWESMLNSLALSGMARAFAAHCALADIDGDVVNLTLEQRHESLRTDAIVDKLTRALSDHLGRPVKLRIRISEGSLASPAEKQRAERERRQREAEAAIEADPVVNEIQKQFGADIIRGSIKPAEENL